MLKILNVIDEFTREALATNVERSIDTDGVVACLQRLPAQPGAPVYVRLDRGSAISSPARSPAVPVRRLRDGVHRPGSPWQNAWIESSNGREADEPTAAVRSLLEAQVLTEAGGSTTTSNRPHSVDHGLIGSPGRVASTP